MRTRVEILLDRVDTFDIGRQFHCKFEASPSNMNRTMNCFRTWGITPSDKDELTAFMNEPMRELRKMDGAECALNAFCYGLLAGFCHPALTNTLKMKE